MHTVFVNFKKSLKDRGPTEITLFQWFRTSPVLRFKGE